MKPLNLTEPAKIKAAKTYNSAADHFDNPALGFWDVHGRRTIELLALRPGSTVLDVGCGTGASALPAAEVVGPGGRVIGVDLAQSLLDRAKAKADQRQLRNVEFLLGDMTNLGYPDHHFDAVVSVFSIFFVPDMEGLVRELWRMVRSGGKLAITTWGPNFLGPVYTVWREAVRAERPDLYSAFNPWDRITMPDQVHKLLDDSGVPNAEVLPESCSQALQSPEDWWTIVLGNGTRATVDAMNAEEAARLRDHTIAWTRDNGIKAVETNAIYAVSTKNND
jgi:ubiquinone/menaquinone biosynthesis C-methylase UbiE